MRGRFGFTIHPEEPVTNEEPVDHRQLAVSLFNRTWELLDQETRTDQERDEMLTAAFASRHHWREVGEPQNFAISEWQVARVAAVLGYPDLAEEYGRRSLHTASRSYLGPFYEGYAHEALARAARLAGNRGLMAKHLDLAHEMLDQIVECLGAGDAGRRPRGAPRTMINPDPKPIGTHPWGDAATPYEQLGGEGRLRQLIDSFYDHMDADSPTLRAMHPADDSNSRRNLFEFLSGWMGGPDLYTERKGQPRLRMRHLPFAIGSDEASEWMRCMRAAFDDVGVDETLRAYLDSRLEQTAQHVRNTNHD